MAQQGSPPGRPPRDYPSPDELSPQDGRESDHGPAEQGAHHRGRAERPLRPRRAERPERQAWDYGDPFAPGADANLPSWAPPSEFPSDRPPASPRRPGRSRAEVDDVRSFRRLGHRRPDGGSDHHQSGYDQPGYDRTGSGQSDYGQALYDRTGSGQSDYGQAGYDRSGSGQPGYDRPGSGQSGSGQAGYDRSGSGQSDYGEPGYDRSGSGQSDYDRSGSGQAGYDQSGSGQAGYDRSGSSEPGYGQPGFDQSGFSRPGSDTARPARRRPDNGREPAAPGYERPERAASHRKPSYDEQTQGEHGYTQQGHADQGSADQGHAGQGYADQGYASRGYGERPSGSHHRPDGERPSGGHHRPDGERPSGGHHRPDGERPSGGHHRPDADALAYQQPATDLRNTDLRNTDFRNTDLRNTDLRNTDLRNTDLRNTDRAVTDWGDTGEFEHAAPGYGRPDYARRPDGDWQGPDGDRQRPDGTDRDRPRHGRPGNEAAGDGYDGESASDGHYSRADYAGRDPGQDSPVAAAGSPGTDTCTNAAADAGAVGPRARVAGLPGRITLPGRVRRGRAAAARLRKSRRKVYRWSGVGIAVCVVVALVVVLTHHGPKPLPYVTTLLPGEFKSVPAACDSVSATVLNHYLPGPGRTTANQMSGSTQSECSFTVDRKPVFLELNVTAQAFEPFAPATAAGSKPGSATANAADNFTEVQQGLAHPSKTAPQSPARILPLAKVGQQAFVAVASQHVTGIDSEIVTVVIRERNVLITVAESGQQSGHGFGPVSVGALEAGAQAAAKDVLAKAETQPTA